MDKNQKSAAPKSSNNGLLAPQAMEYPQPW